jgi:hypothetical protein
MLMGGWNAVHMRFAPFPGTTAANFYHHVGDSCYEYIGKPLIYSILLGSLAAGLLSQWAADSPV